MHNVVIRINYWTSWAIHGIHEMEESGMSCINTFSLDQTHQNDGDFRAPLAARATQRRGKTEVRDILCFEGIATMGNKAKLMTGGSTRSKVTEKHPYWANRIGILT